MTTLAKIVTLAAVITSLSSNAQEVISVNLDWGNPALKGNTDQHFNRSTSFEGAFFDASRENLPFYAKNVRLKGNVDRVEILMLSEQYEALSSSEIQGLKGLGDPGTAPLATVNLGWQRKQPVAQVAIYPYRKNASTGQLEKLVSFEYELDVVLGGTIAGGQSRNYPAVSRMASGDWYRFTVENDGIHVIDQQFLIDLGVDVSGLSSSDINIYGNHYGQLSYENSVPYTSDLYLNRIMVEDGGDGSFDAGDRILFYATGADTWRKGGNGFVHHKNTFTDEASYFVGIGVEPASRISDLQSSGASPTHQVTSFSDRQVVERDNTNLIKSGREFYGDRFDAITEYNYQFVMPNLTSDDVLIDVDVFSRTLGINNSSSFDVSVGAVSNNLSVSGITDSYTGAYGRPASTSYTVPNLSSPIQVNLKFNKHNAVTSIAFTNFVRVNARRNLIFSGSQLMFRDLESEGMGNVAQYTLDGANSVWKIWEITNPTDARNVVYTDNGSTKQFTLEADSLREFIAFRNTGFLEPTAVGQVENQNIHATQNPVDLVMVVHPNFTSEAQRIKDQRESEGLEVIMVTPQEVYNEFSSGMRDATAIKKMMKMFYDRAGTDLTMMPRYLLLFGDGSYINKGTAASAQAFIPTYQTANSYDLSRSYCSEDYYGLLDDSEGEHPSDLVDIGIGRLPAHTVAQAKAMVDKVLRYPTLVLNSAQNLNNCQEDGGNCVKDWRNRVLFVSDDQEGDGFEGTIHMSQSHSLANSVEADEPGFIVDRILMDAYNQISTPGGERYPDGTSKLQLSVDQGLLLVNYVGHGGEVGWGHERFLDVSTILGWNNSNCLPLFMTATCEFTRWDDPGRTSAGEFVIFNDNGGGIGLFTTTRLAYSNANFILGQFFYDHVFKDQDALGRTYTLGDIFRDTKVDIATAQPGSVNHRNFSLLGDPSLPLQKPKQQVLISSVTDTLGNPVDTLGALGVVRMSGIVADGNGAQLNGFNGVVIPVVFDKKRTINTLANDGGNPFAFQNWSNVIYRGQATVANGEFSFDFVVPKDISYQFGSGRVVFYAESEELTAHGSYEGFLVGGADSTAAADNDGPSINIFMNDENFVPGGLTDNEPVLVAELFDVNGINTLGNSIGHDLKATLDGNTDGSIILNDFYEADLDTYKSGTVRYRLTDLDPGPHTLELKAWDVHNNSSKATTDFVVAESADLALDHVLNYPNPFTTHTDFFFEHNKACSFLDVRVQVFSVSGRLVKTLIERVNTEGFRSDPISWDGRDDYGDKLGRGVYVYKLNVITPEGESAEQLEKLVILK